MNMNGRYLLAYGRNPGRYHERFSTLEEALHAERIYSQKRGFIGECIMDLETKDLVWKNESHYLSDEQVYNLIAFILRRDDPALLKNLGLAFNASISI